MGSGQSRLAFVCLARRIDSDCPGTELAHASRGGDGGYAIQLGVGATNCGTYLSERESQQAGGRDGADSIAGHHAHDLALLGVEVGHQVRRSGETVRQLQSVERVGARRGALSRDVELDSQPRAEASEVPAFAVPSATVIDREPEGAEQVVFVGDAPRRHDDCRDRIVHDLFLRAKRDAARLAAAPQLSHQLGAAPV
jgi:hypothetical protein